MTKPSLNGNKMGKEFAKEEVKDSNSKEDIRTILDAVTDILPSESVIRKHKVF